MKALFLIIAVIAVYSVVNKSVLNTKVNEEKNMKCSEDGAKVSSLQIEELTISMPGVLGDIKKWVPYQDVMSKYSGGWGYGKEKAVVLMAEDEAAGVNLEYPFLYLRGKHEVFEALKKSKVDKTIRTIKIWNNSQRLIEDVTSADKKIYDVLNYEVNVQFDDSSYFTYDAECWFDITSFFGIFPQK